MRTFYRLLGVALVAITTTNFVWFALTYWAYLMTRSVISTSVLAGIWLVAMALSSNLFGSIVDRYKKKHAMMGSSIASLLLFASGLLLFSFSAETAFATVMSLRFWIFAIILLLGVIAGSMYGIAVPTLVAFLVPEDRLDRANGLFGTVMGTSFVITSAASGLALAFGGMSFVLLAAIIFTLFSAVMLWTTSIPETASNDPAEDNQKKMDIRGTVVAMKAIPGLFALIFFATINNFLGGSFAALMDAYGLSLVTVQVWGLLWAFLSLSFVLGGLYISKRGLGTDPLRNLFRINIVLWTVCIFFTVQPSIALLSGGVFIYMFFIPFIEAIEQTILQRVVPKERLGRVFGLAHSIELAASPIMAFFIGPVAQLFFIPFMTTGQGVELIGSWFGVGAGRGIALVFILVGCIGLTANLIAMRSRPYRLLAARYNETHLENH